MSTIKILYKTKKWDKELQNNKKMNSIEMYRRNVATCIDCYTHPENHSSFPKTSIDDPVSFYYQLGSKYIILSGEYYLLEENADNLISHLYLYVLALSKAYELAKSGVEITNPAIEKAYEEDRDLEKVMFCATAIVNIELFEEYGTNLGCEIIKAMYHEDYAKAEELVSQLPDTAEIYEKEKYWASYCYESKYLKALYQAILSKDEKAFNKALADRIKFIRKGYVMPIDVVSVTMIKFARKLGLDYNFDVIEIPKALLEDLSDVPFEEYQLPEV